MPALTQNPGRLTAQARELATIEKHVKQFQARPQYRLTAAVNGITFVFTKFGPALYDVRQTGDRAKDLKPRTVTCPELFLTVFLLAVLPDRYTIRDFKTLFPNSKN